MNIRSHCVTFHMDLFFFLIHDVIDFKLCVYVFAIIYFTLFFVISLSFFPLFFSLLVCGVFENKHKGNIECGCIILTNFSMEKKDLSVTEKAFIYNLFTE